MQSVVVSSTTDHLPAEQRSTKSKGKEKERSDAIEFDGTTVLCRVCGDKASGFHYGVHSCEGCKGFFRRSIQQKIQYRPCTKNQQCSILRINRNRCQYCRLKKCIAVGMSRDAVRFGRVPKREKAKILAAMQSVNARSQERALSAELEDEPRLIATIIKAHEQTCDYTQEKVGPLLQRAHADPVYTQCPPQLACPLNPNPHPLQNGNQRILEDFSERFSPAIRGVVEFAKRIPGFSLLSQDDQVTLLKAGVFEVLLVRLACMFDSHSNTMLCLNGQVLKRESVHNSSNARFLMDSMFDFAERLNMLRLRDAELGLFCAVVIITADRPGLRNTELVEKMQSKMMQALQNVVSQSHPELPGIFQELMKKIPDLRTLNTLHSEKLLAFKMEPRNNTGAGGSGMGSMVPATNVTTTISNCISAPIPGSWPDLSLSQMQTHRSPSASNDDSKSSWEERDLIRSPDQRSTSAGSDWSLTEGKEPGSEGYSSPRSIETVPFSLDDSGAKNGTTGDNESICSGEVAQITELHMHPSHLAPPKRHRDLSQSEGGASSGDEGSVAESLSRCPFKLRKLESPSGDSGIESGKDISSNGTHSTGTSMCGSPRSLVDEKVKDMDVCYSEPTDSLNKAKTSDSSNSIVVSDPTDDMPVLKRALQAPPLINTNLLMDEAYKPHKKFRALRKETEVPNSENNNSASVAPTASPIQLSLASTHSTLVRTLEQGPRMTKQQLKRTDIIHNIIMRSENQMHGDGSQEQCSSIPTTLYGSPAISNTPPMNMMTTGGGNSIYNTSSSTFIAPGHPHSHNSNHHGQPMHQHPQHHQHPSSTGASKNMVVCAPSYYIPQPNINLAAATPYSATWPFVAPTSGTGVPSGPTAATATTAVIAQAMQIRPSATYMPSGQPATIAVQLQPNVGLQPSQLSPQHLQQHPSTHRLTTVSLQGPHSTTPSPQPPSSLSAAGTPASSPSPQLPRMYYDPRSSTPTTLPSAGPPATASTVVTFSPNSLPLQQGNNYVAFSNKQPQMASKPASPMGEQQLVEIQVDISENQPLNLSKKMASPPPTTSHESSTLSTDTTTVLLQLQQQSHHQQQQQKVKLERV